MFKIFNMSCNNPMYALRLAKDDGKNVIKLLPRRVDEYTRKSLEAKYGHDSLLVLPCGHCTGCKLDYAKQWATRCMLEAKYHDKMCFVTLTYSVAPDHPDRNDFNKMIKSMRNDGIKVRYFGCFERGEKNHRWHIHVILFGYEPDDLVPFGKNEVGDYTFISKSFSKYWTHGFHLIGSVTFESAGYIARYSAKGIKTDPEAFTFMSLKPGIGAQYIIDNMDKIYQFDKVFGRFGSLSYVKPPRYADRLLARADNSLAEHVSQSRISRASLFGSVALLTSGFENYEELLSHNEINLEKKLKLLNRSSV